MSRFVEIDGKLYEKVRKKDCNECSLGHPKVCATCYALKEHDVSQYDVKPIDYSECDSLVAYFLKQGLALQHKGNQVVWKHDEINNNAMTFGYWSDAEFDRVEEFVVKGKRDLILTLLDEGYEPNNCGIWDDGSTFVVTPNMFEFCGKPPSKNVAWRGSWLERK